jgi:hypothetical protein
VASAFSADWLMRHSSNTRRCMTKPYIALARPAFEAALFSVPSHLAHVAVRRAVRPWSQSAKTAAREVAPPLARRGLAYASASHFFRKPAFAAPASGLPFLSIALGS